MSHDIFNYQNLPALSDALQDVDTIPVNNVSIGADTQEKMTVQALRGAMLYSSPVGAYIGLDGVANEVAFGNFRIRMNPANNATEISAIAGTESTEIYRFAAWGAGAFDNTNYNALALTAGTWTIVDPLVLSAGDDMVRYWISRSNLADPEWYEVYVWRPLLGKTCIEAKRLGFQGPASIVANDFFQSIVTGNAPDGINDLTEGIRRTGFVGVGGVNPSSALHTTSFGAKTVNHFGPANYATNNLDHTLRFAQGCPTVGVTLHAASAVPGQVMVISNSSLFAQTITNPPIPLNGIGSYPSLAIGASITIQSVDGFWCVIDSGSVSVGLPNPDFFRTTTGATLPDGVNDLTESITRTGMIFAKGFKAESALPIGGNSLTEQSGFYFSGTEGDGGMHSFPGTDGAIGFAVDSGTRVILRSRGGSGAWSLNAGTIAQAQAIPAHHYVGVAGGPSIASQINLSSAGSSVGQYDGVSLLLTNDNKTNASGPVASIVASDSTSPFSATGVGARIDFLRRGSSSNNNLGVGIGTLSNSGFGYRMFIETKGQAFHNCDSDATGILWGSSRGSIYAATISHNGTSFSLSSVTPWVVSSDSRYKSTVNRIPTTKARNVVMGVQPSTWEWNDLAKTFGMQGGSIGFVAQQVKEFAPEVVSEINDQGYLGIAESKMIPYLWAAVQGLIEEVDRLKASTRTNTALTTSAISPTPSVNMVKIGRLTSMNEPQLTAIGFTSAQSKMFIAGSGAIKLGMASRALTEPDALRLLSSLLSSIELTLSEVMGKL